MQTVAAPPSTESAAPAHVAPAPAHVAVLSQHPLLVGLWEELPDPKTAKLSPAKQAQWLEVAKLVLQLLYGTDRPGSPDESVPR